MKIFNQSLILFAALFCTCTAAFAQTPAPVKVTAWGLHFGGQITYKYRIQNLGVHPIDRIFIGFYPPTATADGAAELSVAPYYPEGTTMWLPSRVSQSPAGWGVNTSYPDESATFALDWIEASHYRRMRPKADSPDIPVPTTPPNIMPPGATWEQFSVTVPMPDLAYIQGHANFFYGHEEFTVQIEKGDTSPPVLTLALSPNTLPPSGKLVPITATITVKDDYDPAPEIKLESITPNEPVERGDIRDAALGTDDRQFMLKAERDGKNKAGRSYTVIYSATDASGNQSIASARITVPHDLRGHEDHHKDGDRKDKDERGRDR